ncbi:MAG TPA: DUF4252 domain-containing protein [Terriglobales bacterium]|nr:DUF4252 domain-containing protein [Terriglobales bacterium]
MKLPAFLLSFLLTTSAAIAQTQAAQQNWAPQQNWFPQEIESLGQYASSRTEFSLDHNMVVLASKADQEDDSLRRVIAGVDGISVHRFKFQGGGMYDPRILSTVRQEYQTAGWQHLADAHDKYGYPKATDLWLHFDHNTIRNIAVLFTGADQVSFVSVSGSISPIDLLHLAGHFGIPRIGGGVVVQTPGTGTTPAAPVPDTSVTPPSDNGPVDYRHENPAPDSNPPPDANSPTTPN